MTPPRFLLSAFCFLLIPTLPLQAADGFSSDGNSLWLNTDNGGHGFLLDASTDANAPAPSLGVDYIDFRSFGQKPFWTWAWTDSEMQQRPQMELDGENNQLRLFGRTSSEPQIYLDPSGPAEDGGHWQRS